MKKRNLLERLEVDSVICAEGFLFEAERRGKLAGISGIFANTITNSNNRFANILFLLGLIIGPSIYLLINNANFEITKSIPLIIIGGFLVGFGTKLGSGCTSGHGVCGISRLSVRSIVATLLFVIIAMITVFVLQKIGIH